MLFAIKILVAATIIALASWLAGRKPVLAGFLIALPLTSMIAMVFAYVEHQDMDKIHKFSVSILAALPLSLLFFVPFICHRWLKLSFVSAFVLGLFLLSVAYLIHSHILKPIQG